MGIPIVGCTCAVCTSSDPRNRRMRTAALLRIADQTLLIDAGPDFRMQALAARIQKLDAVLLTHSHFDHVAGLDDLRPLPAGNSGIPVFGRPDTLADVRRRFDYAFAATSNGSTRPALELCPVTAPFMVGPTRVIPFDIMHGTWTITGYRIGALGYITDASTVPAAARQVLRNLDVLVLNALRYDPHPTHLSISQALEVIADLRPRRTLLVHMTHTVDHTTVNAQLPAGVELAYDGLEIEVVETQ